MRFFFLTAFALLLAAAAGGCVSSAASCTQEARAGLMVTVRNASTQSLVCDADVVAESGGSKETLMADGPAGNCGYTGAVEKPGTYVLTVAKAGFQTQTTPAEVVTMTADGCHVNGVSVSVTLSPM